MLPRIVTFACVLLSLAAAVCLAAPRGAHLEEVNAADAGVRETAREKKATEEIHSRVRRDGRPSNYWWIPGSNPGPNPNFNHISCGDPGRPQFGTSLFESVRAGSLVVHSCNPGYKLVGAKLRLCQNNGHWTPELPQCFFVDCGDPGAPIHGTKWVGSTSLNSIVKYMCDPGFRLVGESFRVCRSSGAWSGHLPSCQLIGCPKLPPPKNGKVAVDAGAPGSVTTAHYTCNSGFELVGSETRVCGQDGIWQGTAPFCKIIDCGPLPAPENGRVTFKVTTFGSVAYYECDAGFTLVGEDTRTCQSSGAWSGREPSCRALECDHLPDIPNGRVIITSPAVGSTARYVCDPGFLLVGRAIRTCEADGKWSGEEPVCRVVSCDHLSPPANGGVDLSGTSVGSTAAYYCKDDFLLDGESIRICQSGGQWSGLAPFCNPIDCKSLAPPENGQVLLSGTSFGSTATYSCQPGFALVGNSVRTCGADGLWSGRTPICQPSGCRDLPDPPNGRVILTGTTLGSLATYICNNGFQLEGTRTRICLVSGKWSGAEPRCTGITCPALVPPANGRVSFPSTTVGSEASYSCNPGFVLRGAESRFCMTNGQWSGQAPTCARAHCSFLQPPKNGDISFSQGTFFGSVATYSCDPSFVLVGSPTRVCQADGEWSGVAPVCQPSGCDPLPDPANGRVSISGTTVGSTAFYSCNKGFQLEGAPSRLCQLDRTWSGQEPFCRVVDCGPLPDPANGRVSLTGTVFDSTATYSCFQGFSLVGSRTRTCQENGVWSGSEPFCTAIGCDRLDSPENGRVILTGTTVGSTATYDCIPGFRLVGTKTRVCLGGGVWSDEAPFCTPVVCPSLPDPANGRVSLSGTTAGSTATYSCDRGFGLVGFSTRICQASGEWSGEEPTCEPTQCQVLRPPANGIIKTTGTQYGDTATYDCLPGYILVGGATRTCLANGFWSGTEPFCQAVECDYLESPENGEVVQTGTLFGSTAIYTCFPGFELVGEETRTCQRNGEWTGTEPFCRPVTCGPLPDIPFGSVSLSGISFGSVATYTCVFGYNLVGSITRTCQANGQWSGSEPVCEGFQCPPLDPPQNGQVFFTETSVGSTATYSCFPGFSLVGEESRICQQGGQWSGSAPFCRGVTCEVLKAPENGRIVLTGTDVGDTASYSCLPGFQLQGVELRRCLDNGEWAYEEPVCIAIQCPDLPDPENGKVSLSGTTFGSTATYQCENGFGLVGIGIRLCQADGSWSGREPTCEISDCGGLEPPANGNIETTGTKFWDTASYSCTRGYVLVGEAVRTCEASGFWSGTAPFCSSVECPILDPPKDGKVFFTSTSFGAVARYECISGFELLGDEERTCLEDGQWSGSDPICEPVSCDILLPPENGEISFSRGSSFGSVATYSCNPPYLLAGSPTRVCQSNREWSGVEPVCEAVECPFLEPPGNGEVDITGTLVGSTATYFCDDGFVLVGSEIRICQNNGFWTGVTPLCQPSSCPNLKAPDNGDISLTGTTIGSTATYTCEAGFFLEGDEVRTCLNNGVWSGVEPICLSIFCEPLSDPENGQVELTGRGLGDQATYTCNPGFILFGKGIRDCREGGKWNGKAPVCQIVDCGPLSSPDNGEVITTGTTFGFTASYLCDPGYVLIGFSQRVCQINGAWAGDEPFCRAADCVELLDPENGQVLLTGNDLGDTATYTCDVGFRLSSGSEIRVCGVDAQWSGTEPICSPVDCGDLRAPDNGRLIFSAGTTFGSIVTYSCNPGYERVGLETRTCVGDGTWTGTAPTCEIVDCGQLSPPLNGQIVLSGTTFGSEATYSCQPGFTLVGVEVRVCQAEGAWSGEAPFCSPEEDFDCGPLISPANGKVDVTGTSVGSLATYSCNRGFQLAGGNEFRRCLNGIGWEGTAPSCEPLECAQLSPPLNGRVMMMGNIVGSIAVYQCLEGYLLLGSMIRTCMPDALWSGDEPICSALECIGLPNPANGEVILTGVELGSVARYSCFEGFSLEGEASRTCQSDGVWSGDAPTCERTGPTDCGDPGTPDDGIRLGDDFRIGATVYYECNTGFELVGLGSRACQPDGLWTGFLPTCQRAAGKCHVENGATVHDACGRRCTCQNEEFVDCCRVRSDFASLEISERRRYINAVIRAATDPEFKPRYDALVAKYKDSFDTLAQETDPRISQFFPWHRYFLLEYENLLREIDCRITIPYWDWTALPMNPYMSPLWNSDSGFGDSSRPNDSCVNNGPFRFDTFQVTPSADGGCLRRQYRIQMFPTRAIIEQDLLPMLASEFIHFHQFLQVFLHTNVRCFVGGQMCTPDAANDPAYILHIAQNDALLTRWQDIDEERLNVQYSTDGRVLVLAGGQTVSQFSNNQNLPNDIKICYNPSEFQSHVPENMRFLSPALREMTDNHNLHMQCIGHEEMEGIGMTHGAEEFMHKMCDE